MRFCRKRVLITGVVVGSLLWAHLVPDTLFAAADCRAQALGAPNVTGATGQFVLGANGTLSAKFEVKGPSDCRQALTLTVRQSAETAVFSQTSGIFGPGLHTLKVKLPQCMYDANLSYGTQQLSVLHAGAKKCEPVPKTASTLTPAGVQTLPETGVRLPLFSTGVVAVLAGLAVYIWQWRTSRKP